MSSPASKPRPLPSPDRAPACDLCPTLRTIRLRLGRRLGSIDAEILAYAHPIANGVEKLAALQRERASLVEALELVAAASERAIDRAARARWLEILLASPPACLRPKARQRLRHLIDGLGEPPLA